MENRSKKRRLIRWTTGLLLTLGSLGLAASAQARLYVDQIPPTLCKSSSLSFIGDKTEYNGTAIGVDPSADVWDYDIVMCPISRFRPGDEVREMRIVVEGDRATNGWCQLYNAPDHETQVDFQYPRSSGSNRGIVSFDPPTAYAADGLLGLTARCLLFPGNSITAIEIIWDV